MPADRNKSGIPVCGRAPAAPSSHTLCCVESLQSDQRARLPQLGPKDEVRGVQSPQSPIHKPECKGLILVDWRKEEEES